MSLEVLCDESLVLVWGWVEGYVWEVVSGQGCDVHVLWVYLSEPPFEEWVRVSAADVRSDVVVVARGFIQKGG